MRKAFFISGFILLSSVVFAIEALDVYTDEGWYSVGITYEGKKRG
jgi:hypothetical protein